MSSQRLLGRRSLLAGPGRLRFLAILWVLNAIFVIIAAVNPGDGELLRYQITIRSIQ